MTIDARAASGNEMSAEIVVVGAGPAGVAIAARAGGRGGRVLVVESGGLTLQPDLDLARGSVDRPYYDLSETRLRGLGGSSGCWGGWCERLRPADLSARPWMAHSGWPLEHDALARYYPDAERFCGIPPGFEAGGRSWCPGGRRPALDGVFAETPYAVVGRRNLGADHRAVFDRRGVDLLLHATVTEIVTSADGGRVDRLVIQAPGGARFTVLADTVVLAAGGFENARLLLASKGDGWPAGIGNGHELVGRFFMEHPHVDALRIRAPGRVDLDTAFFEQTPDRSGVVTGSALALADDVCEAAGVGRARIFLEKAGAHLDGRPTIRRDGRRFLPRYAAPAEDELAVVVISEQAPNPDSRVTLAADRDRYGVPLVRVRWGLTDLDHRTVSVAAAYAREVLGGVGGAGFRSRLRPGRWPLDTLGGPHHLGTTRMAADARHGVVDSDCLVHGVANLYVAGGSVFPTVGFAPPTLTIVALAMRLADHMAAPGSAGQERAGAGLAPGQPVGAEH